MEGACPPSISSFFALADKRSILSLVRRPSSPAAPLVMHIAVREHTVAIQQHHSSILGGFNLAVRLLVRAQENSFSQNRAEHK